MRRYLLLSAAATSLFGSAVIASEKSFPITSNLLEKIGEACWGDIQYTGFIGFPYMSYGPHLEGREICLLNKGEMSVTTFSGDEGLGDGGKFSILDGKIRFENESGAEGWMAFFAAPVISCTASLSEYGTLALSDCSDGTSHSPYKPQPVSKR